MRFASIQSAFACARWLLLGALALNPLRAGPDPSPSGQPPETGDGAPGPEAALDAAAIARQLMAAPPAWTRRGDPFTRWVASRSIVYPSRDDRGAEARVGAMAAYFHDFAVAMPDLPGCGLDPSPRPHPYCHARCLAHCVLDLAKAFRWLGALPSAQAPPLRSKL